MSVDDLSQLQTAALFQRTLVLARTESFEESEEDRAHVRILHARGEREVFKEATALCSSPDARSRTVGATVLAQLGVRDEVSGHPFADESEGTLVGLLADPVSTVTASALHALGHLQRGEPTLLASLATHRDARVRHALAFALGGRTDAVSSATLIRLSGDDDEGTRDWATFALGSLSEDDSPAIRDALAARLTDAGDEVRGEAILGLARRSDERAVPPLLQELHRQDVGGLAIDAAEAMPRPEFMPALERLHAAHPGDEPIALALNRCRDVARHQ